jgi:hypothetical protein
MKQLLARVGRASGSRDDEGDDVAPVVDGIFRRDQGPKLEDARLVRQRATMERDVGPVVLELSLSETRWHGQLASVAYEFIRPKCGRTARGKSDVDVVVDGDVDHVRAGRGGLTG